MDISWIKETRQLTHTKALAALACRYTVFCLFIFIYVRWDSIVQSHEAEVAIMQAGYHTRTTLQPQKKLELLYQLAFFTPGMLPAMACIRKLYCTCRQFRSLRGRVTWELGRRPTLDSLKSRNIPLPLPPSRHRPRIWVGRV